MIIINGKICIAHNPPPMLLALNNKNKTWATYEGQENKLTHMNCRRINNSTDDEKQI